MRNPFENSETFTAAATMQASIYMMDELINSPDTRTPIDKLIDKATGYEREMDLKTANQMLSLLEDYIAAKKILELPTERDEQFLELTKKIISKHEII